jgi:membrane-associated protein
VCAIVFVETGLFVGFVLPGDSLLVIAGGVAAKSMHVHLSSLLLYVTPCVIAGDQVGYWVGRRAGQSLYRREDSRFFKRKHLQAAHEFYEKHGGKAIIIAKFAPIIRTFCPPVAGAAEMKYSRYLAYDIAGAFLWVWGLVLFGYLVVTKIPGADKYVNPIVVAVIVVSLIPAAYHAWKARFGGAAASK